MKGKEERAETVFMIKTQSPKSDGEGNFCESTNGNGTDYTSIWAHELVDNQPQLMSLNYFCFLVLGGRCYESIFF